MVPGISRCSPLASLSRPTTCSVEHPPGPRFHVSHSRATGVRARTRTPSQSRAVTGIGNHTSVLAQQLPQPRDEPERLVVLALPDVAAEDDAERPGLHGLAGLLEDALVAGLLAAGEQHRGA